MTALNPRIPACMGGFCAKRDHCAQHQAPTAHALRFQPAERLCTPGRDGDAVGLDEQHAQPTPISQRVPHDQT